MNVVQLPAEYSLTSTILDIILGNAESLNFVISYDGEDILNENYDPSATGEIQIRDLGRIMERYLSGDLLTGRKLSNYGLFYFKVDGVEIGHTLALLCKAYTVLAGSVFHELQYPMHLLYGSKITIPTAKEYISFCLHEGDGLTARAVYLENGVINQTDLLPLDTVDTSDVYTFELSLDRIVQLFPAVPPISIIGYEVGVGEIKTLYKIDWAPYVDTKVFKHLNSFAVPFTLITRGEISRKRMQTFETSKVNGLEKRYAIKRADTFKVSVGRKFSREEESLFAEMISSEMVQIFYRGEFRDIIITEEDSDELQRRGSFSDTSFTFRFSDERLNTMLFDPTWILEDGTWNDWGNWLDDGLWNN